MGQWLNKKIAFILLGCLAGNFYFAQVGTEAPVYKDYKEPKQFDKFYQRRKLISAWQINQLKEGALVVKLKTNNLSIDALTKSGNKMMARKKTLEMLAINLNLTRAYRSIYNFSKVYFMFSNYSDSLLNGQRKNIFLDTNLAIDPGIEMKENFYLLAETDDIYNSSIGFVPEDSAKLVSEHGSKTTAMAPIVIKNKYGHQLKRPFPYLYYSFPISKPIYNENIVIYSESIPFNVTGNLFEDNTPYIIKGTPLRLYIPKDFCYTRISWFVFSLNDNLREYYRANSNMNPNDFAEVKLYLY